MGVHRLVAVLVDAAQVRAEVAGGGEVEDVVGHHEHRPADDGVGDGVEEGDEQVGHGVSWEAGVEGGMVGGGARQPKPRELPPKPPLVVLDLTVEPPVVGRPPRWTEPLRVLPLNVPPETSSEPMAGTRELAPR